MPKKAPPKIRETDLYGPVRDYLTAQGYTVRAEVNHCDIVARKDDDLIVVELKRRVGIDLLAQATERQRISESVYVAIPRPANMGRGSKWRGTKRVLRQLELGLIIVSFSGKKPRVEVAFHPTPYQKRKLKSARRAVIKEIDARSGDYNEGGSSQKKLVTAYRENAIHIACCLDRFGPMSPRELRNMGTVSKTQSIVYSNFYGWFERVDRGVYGITAKGKTEIKVYPVLVEHYTAKLDS